MSDVGLEPAGAADIELVHELAHEIIGDDVASAETLWRVHQHTGGAAVFVYREGEGIAGMLAGLSLTEAGLRALVTGAFDGTSPNLDHVCKPGEAGSAAYGWGYAGRTRRAMAAVIKGAVLARTGMCASLPFFTRGATVDGARLLNGRLECHPYPIDIPGLFWSPAITPSTEAAE